MKKCMNCWVLEIQLMSMANKQPRLTSKRRLIGSWNLRKSKGYWNRERRNCKIRSKYKTNFWMEFIILPKKMMML